LSRCLKFLEGLKEGQRKNLLRRLKFPEKEISIWQKVRTGLLINVDENGIIEQFNGYFGLKELDWDGYRKKYGDIHRLDRILKAEGKSPDEYKLAKQADLIMAFYNLGVEGVTAILNDMGYKLGEDYFSKNFDYYIARTSHGSTLSRLVHSSLEFQYKDRDAGWDMYMEALESDLLDIQGGTTGEGVHCGVMAGTVYKALSMFGGLNISDDIPGICPSLPDHWSEMKYSFKFRGNDYSVRISKDEVELFALNDNNNKIKVHIYGEFFEIGSEERLKVKYRKEYRC
jgi:trehalose/maltose hydrolase-like predicted phosphorylase